MSKTLLESLLPSWLTTSKQSKSNLRRRSRSGRKLSLESLESRQMLSITTLADLNSTENFGEKPQSKVFEYAGQWWSVVPNSAGTSVFRLDGTSWTETQRISTNSNVHADVKLVGDLAHVLLYDGTNSQVASLQYDAVDNRYEPWALQPNLVDIQLSSGVETATLEVDSTGRMWIASDASSTIEVRYSDGLYTNWSSPITIATGITSDDISAIVAMPGNRVGVIWSNQSSDRFGFRTHIDGSPSTAWTTDEIPASQSALNVGGGMADDHVHLATSSDGTLYAAVKTSYDKSGYPKIALLVRRPNGVWDDLYEVDGNGTRPIVVVDESAGKLIVAYTSGDNGGDIIYRESPLGTISFSPVQVLIGGSLNNVTSTKVTSTNSAVFMADSKAVLYTFDTATPNQAPIVNAGADRTATTGTAITLSGSATDDGKPTANPLGYQWSTVSGPGTVNFGSPTSASTSVTFSAAGTYVLQLAASDGQLTGTDQVSVVVSSSTPPGGGGASTEKQLAFQNGLFPNVAYAGSTDTKIAAKKSKSNYGNSSSLTIDGSPDEAGLFRWDISAIPVGSTVASVSIELTVTTASTDTYEVYALRRAWDELSATWKRYATGSNWSVAGASGSADQSSTVLGQLAATTTGLYRINLNAAGVAAVQTWINDPSQNYGIIIKDYTVSKAVGIRTSEYGTASQRPKLVIDYTTSASANLLSDTDPPPETNPPVTNQPPVVNAGADRTATVATAITLNGSATDDGQPTTGPLGFQWSKISGPGTVTFGSSTSASTAASFSLAGTYVLQLAASDGQLTGTDQVSVVVSPASDPGGSEPGTEQQIAFQNGLFPNVAYAGSTDTKIYSKYKNTNYGNNSSFTIDGSPDEAGLFRWDVSAIPAGSAVTSASIELYVTSSSSDSYEVYALKRAWDELSATWNQYAAGSNWSTGGANSTNDASSTVLGRIAATTTGTYRINLNAAGVAAVQTWINDPSQNYGIIIKDYTVSKAVGIRTSEYGTASQRPKLVINYTEPAPINLPPTVNVGSDLTAQINVPLTIGATVSDDGQPGGSALLTALWTVQSGPATATFGNSTAVNTTATFSVPGLYTLRLTVSDSVLSGFDELSVTVG